MKAQTVEATVLDVQPLTDSILRLILKPDLYIDYHAGQYLQIITTQHALSYSIANAPLGSQQYELHIRHTSNNATTQSLLADIERQGRVTLRLPLGDCHLSALDAHKPIIFIAGGTGFAPIKALIEQLLMSPPRPFELFWGARSKGDLYMDDKAIQWQTHVQSFKYVTCISDASKKTLVDHVLERHTTDLSAWQIVISGPLDMVYSTRDALMAHGVLLENLFSDAFENK